MIPFGGPEGVQETVINNRNSNQEAGVKANPRRWGCEENLRAKVRSVQEGARYFGHHGTLGSGLHGTVIPPPEPLLCENAATPLTSGPHPRRKPPVLRPF